MLRGSIRIASQMEFLLSLTTYEIMKNNDDKNLMISGLLLELYEHWAVHGMSQIPTVVSS